MNSRKNSFKRVAAGALAVLTVAAYTAPVANVGGLTNINVLTADAAETTKAFSYTDGLQNVLVSVSDTVETYSNTQIKKLGGAAIDLTVGKTATIKSQTPLTFDIPAQTATATEAIKNSKVAVGYQAKVTTAFSEGTTNYIVDQVLPAGTTISSNNQGNCEYKQITFTSGKNSYSVTETTTSGYKNYTYKFNVPNYDFSATAKESNIDIYTAKGDKISTKEITDAVSDGATVVSNAPAKVWQNEKFKLYSADCFTAYVYETDGTPAGVNTKVGVKTYNANYVSDKEDVAHYGKYFVEIPALIHAEGYNSTAILINKTNPSISYTLTDSNTKLKATGSGIDTVAASISATAVAPDKTGVYPTVDPEKNVLATNSSAQKNKSRVDLSLSAESKFLAQTTVNSVPVYGVLKITLNGKELEDTAKPLCNEDGSPNTAKTYKDIKDAVAAASTQADLDVINSELKFNTAGSYVVTYTVYTAASNGAITARNLTYKFSIATLDKLTINNVKVEFDPTNSSTGVEDILVKDPKTNLPAIKLVNGVYTIEVLEGKSLNGKTVAITAELYTDTKKTVPFIGADISGSQMVSSVDKTQTLNISYNDPEYSSKEETIALKWKVTKAAKSVVIINSNTYKALDGDDIFDIADAVASPEGNDSQYGLPYKPKNLITSIDEISELETKIKENIAVVNGDIDKVSFEYVNQLGATLDDSELDTHIAGLPSKQGEYSVYILYNGVAKNIINVKISEHGLYAAPTSNQTNLTYGDKLFNETNLAYVNYSGKKVSKPGVSNIGIKVYTTYKLTKSDIKDIDEETGLWLGDKVYDINGSKYVADSEFEFSADMKSYEKGTGNKYKDGDLLPAGNYIVVVDDNNETAKVEKDGYALLKKDFVVTVAKKAITKDMVLIDPATYNDGKSVDMGDIHGADANAVINGNAYDIDLKLADGVSSGKKVGGYDATITIGDDEENYTGSVDVQWFIVKEGDILAGLDWNESVTTLYDNGKIHFEFTRPADSNLDAAVQEYGILVEKNGKIAAPTTITDLDSYLAAKNNGTYLDTLTADVNVQAAYTALQYGNGMVASGKQSKTQAKENGGQICGVNVSVLNAEVGAWARPYLVLKDGSIHYGEVRYLNLTYEAYDKLNLKITQVGTPDQVYQNAVTRETVKKDLTAAELKDKATWRQDVFSGYNEAKGKYYVYANYNLSEDTNVKPNAVQAFGFVADKAAKIGTLDEIAVKYPNADDRYKYIDESLRINKGFTEGRASKTSTTMDFDEIGANITPVDSATGVWVRSFVDFGNGLVVYTEPQYLFSVSAQYLRGSNDYTPSLVFTTDGAKNVYSVSDPTYYPSDDNGEVEIKTAGVIIDNNGSLYKWDKTNDKYVLKEGAYPTSALTRENASKNGYVASGKAPVDDGFGHIFVGKLTPKTDSNNEAIPVLARPYVVYSINGVEVTVYGNVIEYTDQVKTNEYNVAF